MKKKETVSQNEPTQAAVSPLDPNHMRHQTYLCLECEHTDVWRYFPNESTIPFINCTKCHRRDSMRAEGEAQLVMYEPMSLAVKQARDHESHEGATAA